MSSELFSSYYWCVVSSTLYKPDNSLRRTVGSDWRELTLLETSNNHWLWIRVCLILRAWHLHKNETKGNENESKGVQFPAAEMPLIKLTGSANRQSLVMAWKFLPLCHRNTRLGCDNNLPFHFNGYTNDPVSYSLLNVHLHHLWMMFCKWFVVAKTVCNIVVCNFPVPFFSKVKLELCLFFNRTSKGLMYWTSMKAAKIFWAKLKIQAVSYQMVRAVKLFQPILLTQSQCNLFSFVIIKIVLIHSNISPFRIGVNPAANSS